MLSYFAGIAHKVEKVDKEDQLGDTLESEEKFLSVLLYGLMIFFIYYFFNVLAAFCSPTTFMLNITLCLFCVLFKLT